MTGIDQDKLDGLRELIKLLLALMQAERPRVVYRYPPFMPQPQPVPPMPPGPVPPGSGEGGMNLVRAAEIVERGGARAQEAIRHGTEAARAALLQLAEQRDIEQQAVEQVIEAVSALKALQHRHRHQGEPASTGDAGAEGAPAPSTHTRHAAAHSVQAAGKRHKS
ncbi:hypothetical protein [Dyella sp. ASV21]|uniref:hypothetical protein n=1 Tax=Dyella sp. ASV21 TaxID=2795114 RepID=UPI0018EABC75|nr:hypothetical protein [Dyella sp. ASV21]